MLKIIPSGTTHRTFWRRRTTFYSGEPTQEGEVLWRGIVGAVVVEGDVGHLPRSRGDAPLSILEGKSCGDLQPQGRISNKKSKLCSHLVTKVHFVTI